MLLSGDGVAPQCAADRIEEDVARAGQLAADDDEFRVECHNGYGKGPAHCFGGVLECAHRAAVTVPDELDQFGVSDGAAPSCGTAAWRSRWGSRSSRGSLGFRIGEPAVLVDGDVPVSRRPRPA